MWEIIDRGLIHFFASGGIMLAVLFALRLFLRKFPTSWLPSTIPAQIVFAAVSIFAGAALREAWDVSRGQPIAKAFTDYISWASGCGLAAWGLIRVWRNKL